MRLLEENVARTPLATMLSEVASVARESWEQDLPVDVVLRQNTWEVPPRGGQPGTPGILVDYTGGTIGASFGSERPTLARSSS